MAFFDLDDVKDEEEADSGEFLVLGDPLDDRGLPPEAAPAPLRLLLRPRSTTFSARSARSTRAFSLPTSLSAKLVVLLRSWRVRGLLLPLLLLLPRAGDERGEALGVERVEDGLEELMDESEARRLLERQLCTPAGSARGGAGSWSWSWSWSWSSSCSCCCCC